MVKGNTTLVDAKYFQQNCPGWVLELKAAL